MGTQFPHAKKMKSIRAVTTSANEEEDVDYFGRLFDDIIIDIFGRVNDCKFLTQCLLLNKRTASLIRFVSSVFIKINLTHLEDNPAATISLVLLRSSLISISPIELISWDYNNLTNTSQDIQFQSWWKFRMDNNSFFIREARQVLHPFTEVKTAIVEYSAKFDSISLLNKWMVEYSGGDFNTGIIKSCAFLRTTMTKLESHYITFIISWEISALLVSAFTFYPMVAQMVQGHESLCDILVTSTHSKKGWIHAGEDAIVKMRQTGGVVDAMMMEEVHITMKVKVWYSVANLPGDSDSVYTFVVISGPDNIDHEVKTATSRLLGDCNYWAGHRDDERINMRELVETMPCDIEFTWIANYKAERSP